MDFTSYTMYMYKDKAFAELINSLGPGIALWCCGTLWNIVSSSGVLPEGTKPLPEPMYINDGPVQFYRKPIRCHSPTCVEITHLKS